MTDWSDGYITDVPYVAEYHRETMPISIATAATLLGNGAPDITRPFRYADLGSGSGVTPLIVAATTPHADVWAFDFNPHHIEAGREIARRAELPNIRFVETSFGDLARWPPESPLSTSPEPSPMFDIIVAHGVLSWISPENQSYLYRVIGQRLAPGGIAYVSYNVSTGWTGVRPIACLMRLLAEASAARTDLALAEVFATLREMSAAGAAMFEAHPDLEPLLTAFQGRNQRYVAHELLNSHWRSKMFRVVAAAMASIKCEYIGSAMLVSNIPNLTVPPGCREMFGQARRIDLRETLRDLMAGISFRRDLYQRGPRPAGQLERSRKVDAIALVRTFRPVPDTITIDSALGQITPDQQCFRAMLRVLDAGPTTVGQLRRDPALTRWSDAELQEVAILLISGDYVAPMLTTAPDPAAIAAAARLNRVHTALFEQGQDRPYLVLPALGAAWQVSHLEMLILDELRAGRAEEEAPLFNAVRDRVTRTGRQLLRDGHPVTDPAAAREMVAGAIRDTLRRTAMMRLLGVLDQPARPPAGQALAT